jgi:hypothetical protein
MSECVFETAPLPDDWVRISWKRDGAADPLDFWDVATCDVEEAKWLIAAGEFELQDGSTIPTTVARCMAQITEIMPPA